MAQPHSSRPQSKVKAAGPSARLSTSSGARPAGSTAAILLQVFEYEGSLPHPAPAGARGRRGLLFVDRPLSRDRRRGFVLRAVSCPPAGSTYCATSHYGRQQRSWRSKRAASRVTGRQVSCWARGTITEAAASAASAQAAWNAAAKTVIQFRAAASAGSLV
jgi:hypothetical protein